MIYRSKRARLAAALPLMEDGQVARFNSKVSKTATCWNWTGKLGDGYGRMSLWGREHRVHILAWEIVNGLVPEGLQVDHECRNKACVNPRHLRVVTQKQNLENLPEVRSNNSSGHRGVTWDKRAGKWSARVHHHGVSHSAGRYDDLSDAASAVAALRLNLHTHNALDRVAVDKK